MNLFCRATPERGYLVLSGEDRISFLQGLVSNDVRLVAQGRTIWSALLTPQGKFLFEFFLASWADDQALLIELDAGRTDALRTKLLPYRLRAKVAVDRIQALESWIVWGPDAASRFGLEGAGSSSSVAGGIAFVDPRLAALGVRFIAPAGIGAAQLAELGFQPGDRDLWERIRIGEAVPDGVRDLELEKTVLLEAGFDALAGVSFEKGCYMGQELTARTHFRGLVKRRLVPLTFDGPAIAPGTNILNEAGSEVGDIRSGLDGLALASLRLDALDGPLTAEGRPVHPAPPAWMSAA